MDLRIKDGVELLLLLTEVGHLVGPDTFVRLFLQNKTRMVKIISGVATGQGVAPTALYPLIDLSVNILFHIFLPISITMV